MTITTMGAPPADEPLDAVIARMEAAMAKDAGVGTKAAAHWNADVRRLIEAARLVAAPVEEEAKEYAPYLRMLSSRFASFAHVHDAQYGPGSTSYSIENHERSVFLARLADLLEGGDPDEIARRKPVPSAEVVIADLQARLADAERAAAEAVRVEREACALLCEGASIGFDIEVWIHSTKKEMTAVMAQALAAAIRNRTAAPATPTTESGDG
ncbi:hypothetical protein [Mongoliimonas terrestris]|uniref:hypothetical protein n=1 Tax=Mongoliimonas terrestris TaxID=1709001 RepID=UPI00094967BD|nr:hypothetical protein [Mongoliimonas terrestris]